MAPTFFFQPRGELGAAGGVLSLIAGLFIGFLAGYGAYRVSNDKRDVKLSLFTAFFLTTMMGVRFKRSKKIMPAGLVAGLRVFSSMGGFLWLPGCRNFFTAGRLLTLAFRPCNAQEHSSECC
uniref:Transmembrane protein 14A n=1 Tax=Ovis aries TaxID=9940 RepID=A0AC11EPR2_SHEEP